MRKNKLSHLLEPSLRLYFLCLLVFAGVTALFSRPAALAELAVVLVLYLYFRRSNAHRQKEIIQYIASPAIWTRPPRKPWSTFPA